MCIRDRSGPRPVPGTLPLDDHGVLQPPVLPPATPDMDVCRTAIFGPVIALATCTDFDEALRLSNDTRYGLQAGVFTADLGEVWALSGEVAISPGTGHVYDSATPWMGGSKGPWEPRQQKVRFVPREHIIGRPLLTFWPGFSPFRIGTRRVANS